MSAAIIARRTPEGFTGKPVLHAPGPSVLGHHLWRLWTTPRYRDPLWGVTADQQMRHRAGYRAAPCFDSVVLFSIRHCGGGPRPPLSDTITLTAQTRMAVSCILVRDRVEWAYVVDEKAETLLVLQSHTYTAEQVRRPGVRAMLHDAGVPMRFGMFTSSVWVPRCEVPLSGEEPDWARMEQTEPGDAGPWPPRVPLAPTTDEAWWKGESDG